MTNQAQRFKLPILSFFVHLVHVACRGPRSGMVKKTKRTQIGMGGTFKDVSSFYEKHPCGWLLPNEPKVVAQPPSAVFRFYETNPIAEKQNRENRVKNKENGGY